MCLNAQLCIGSVGFMASNARHKGSEGVKVFNQLLRRTQPGHPSAVRRIENGDGHGHRQGIMKT